MNKFFYKFFVLFTMFSNNTVLPCPSSWCAHSSKRFKDYGTVEIFQSTRAFSEKLLKASISKFSGFEAVKFKSLFKERSEIVKKKSVNVVLTKSKNKPSCMYLIFYFKVRN